MNTKRIFLILSGMVLCFIMLTGFMLNNSPTDKSDAHYENVTYEELEELDLKPGDTLSFDDDAIIPEGTGSILVDSEGNILFSAKSIAGETEQEFEQRFAKEFTETMQEQSRLNGN